MHTLKHLAIILDGNRRWAKEHKLPTLEGHRRGYEQVKTIGLAALDRGVEYFSVFGFSTENWKRSEKEVSYLMDLFHKALTDELGFYLENNVRLRVIGSRQRLSQKLIDAIEHAQKETSTCTHGQINLCINYGGRAEIIDAANALKESNQTIDEDSFFKAMWSHDLPDVDLLIRPSGEKRLSGFLSWLTVYSELKFVDTYWPAFSVEDLDACINEFQKRQRRFGK